MESIGMLERISIEPTIRFGKPCIRGTRLTVGELLLDFPQLCHPHCQESCPLGLTRPPGGPTNDHATAL